MAIYYLEVKIGSKGKGQSAIASAAYRSGTKLTDEVTGKVFNYTRKGGVVHSEIALCDNAPKEYAERETLWNAVHKIEKASNAQIFREIIVAIPKELTQQEQIDLIRDYVKVFTARGMCADWSIHDKHDGNPHAHILLTMRSILEDGTWAAKSKKVYDLDEQGNKIFQKVDRTGRKQYKSHKADYNDWNQKERIEEWRAEWEICCNRYLPPENQIDHRSYKRQGKEIIPQIHEGYAARFRDMMGWGSARCDYNRQVRRDNQKIQAINAQINANEEEMQRLKLAANFDVQQLITLRDKYVRQVYVFNKVKHSQFETQKQERLEIAKKNWEEFQNCVKAVQQANLELERRFIFLHKKRNQILKDEAVEKLQQAQKELKNSIYREAGYEHLINNFDCCYPDEKNMQELETYVQKCIQSLEREAKRELQNNVRLQEYIHMNITPEKLSETFQAFVRMCQNVPESEREETAQLLADTPIPEYLDGAWRFPKIVPALKKEISQVLEQCHLLVSNPTADQPNSTNLSSQLLLQQEKDSKTNEKEKMVSEQSSKDFFGK